MRFICSSSSSSSSLKIPTSNNYKHAETYPYNILHKSSTNHLCNFTRLSSPFDLHSKFPVEIGLLALKWRRVCAFWLISRPEKFIQSSVNGRERARAHAPHVQNRVTTHNCRVMFCSVQLRFWLSWIWIIVSFHKWNHILCLDSVSSNECYFPVETVTLLLLLR